VIAKYGLLGFPLWLLWRWATMLKRQHPDDRWPLVGFNIMIAGLIGLMVEICISPHNLISIEYVPIPWWLWWGFALAIAPSLTVILGGLRHAAKRLALYLFVEPKS